MINCAVVFFTGLDTYGVYNKLRRIKMRETLKNARIGKGLTQQAVADLLGIGLRYYQKIEGGERTGDFAIWDKLEDLFIIHQRKLREISNIHPGRVNSQ